MEPEYLAKHRRGDEFLLEDVDISQKYLDGGCVATRHTTHYPDILLPFRSEIFKCLEWAALEMLSLEWSRKPEKVASNKRYGKKHAPSHSTPEAQGPGMLNS
ncbi:hypothetical protein RJZ90_007615 [Blastomyces dermatitidis]